MRPPPAQTWSANLMLKVLEACVPTWAPGKTLEALRPRDPLYWQMLVEAKKLDCADLYAYNADPEFNPPPIDRLLSPEYARSLCSRVSADQAAVTAGSVRETRLPGDTIALSTADRFGNMVAWVNSNTGAFGSGITVPGHGFVLHNRSALFTLDPSHPNAIAPHKRPFNTLSAGFVMKDDRPLMTITLMGGSMQAQGIGQMLVNVLNLGANAHASTDTARFNHGQISKTSWLESPLFDIVGAKLLDKGHRARSAAGDAVGGYQATIVVPDAGQPAGAGAGRTYRAGSDH